MLRARALLFDMDGTLVDSSAAIRRAYQWWTARHNVPLEPIMAVEKGRPHREVMVEFVKDLDIEVEDELFVAYEENDTEGIDTIPGAPGAIAAAEKGLWAVVTSAKTDLARARLSAAGLPVPSVLVTDDLIANGKPDPECFLLAAQQLQVPPVDCVVFEDSKAGVASGLSAGMTVVGVTSHARHLPAHHHIADFNQLAISIEPNGLFQLEFAD